jgi:quercetin dioxygenase-like cupin family protein
MSVIHRFNGTNNHLRWENVDQHAYHGSFEGITKQIPIGPEEGSDNFHIRYFRVEPGKKSNKEAHPHEHGVLILHGQARVQLNEDFFELAPNDVVFISSNDLHQFTALGDEPLGFICVVVGKR